MVIQSPNHLTRRIHPRPLPRPLLVGRAVALVERGNLGYQRVRWVRVGQQRQNAQEHLADRERRAPLRLQNIKTDATSCVDIRMKDFGAEGDNRRLERILGGEVDAEAEDTAVIGRVLGTEDHRLPLEEVFL